jgi:hypothetical protein
VKVIKRLREAINMLSVQRLWKSDNYNEKGLLNKDISIHRVIPSQRDIPLQREVKKYIGEDILRVANQGSQALIHMSRSIHQTSTIKQINGSDQRLPFIAGYSIPLQWWSA